MKILICFSSRESILTDDEAENIKKLLNEKTEGFINLKCGDFINLKSIEAITDPEEIPFWDAYPLNKDGKSFNRDGQRINLSPEGLEEIKYKLHPKYLALEENLLIKSKNLLK